jgi:diguanylate cyclase (GGDEF)-like protein
MLNEVPYLYVNLTALCCYIFILVAFLAAKKSPEIKAFIIVMVGFIFWTGGSILMRLRVFPGINFWFLVSIMSLFALALLIFLFISNFVQLKGYFLKAVIAVLTLILEILTAFGVILNAPTMSRRADGGIVFAYSIDWAVLFPCLFFLFYVIAIIFVFRSIIRDKGVRTPGLVYIIGGCASVLVGNMLQLIPGNVFPWDTLSGIVFAGLLFWALYKKRMFQMRLLISRSVILVIGGLLCVLAAVNFVNPISTFLSFHYALSVTAVTTIIVITFSVAFSAVFFMLKKLLDSLFTHEEQQNRLLKRFSMEVSQSLNTGDIMSRLIGIITEEIAVGCVYVCLPEEDAFVAAYSSEQLAKKRFRVSADNPCVKYLENGAPYLMLSDFKKNPLYLSVWQTEKDLFQRLSLACVFALKDGDNIVGLVLLTTKEKGAQYNYIELSFLETVSSIASIAVKNAGLYEQMYREARIDSLTDVYNYRFFIERIKSEFDDCRDDSIGLLYIDLDDFKLYNQLYGSVEGDKALHAVADIIKMAVGDSGMVFRYSGKVFAVILPHYDGRQAELLARVIRKRMDTFNSSPERRNFKPLTFSCGICVSPYSASSYKELVDHANFAVYNAKEAGKDRIILFKDSTSVFQKVSDKALSIIENASNLSAAYQANMTTISALTSAIDAKDHYTYKHSRNVAMYSAILAAGAGMNEDQIKMIYEAGLLHDIGKISIPENILSKKGHLTNEEYSIMKDHVNNSIDMIRHLPSMDYVIPAAVGHHEHWDGKGYPLGLSGQDIPVAARCLAIADAYDAMTTDRAYHKSMSPEEAVEQIESCAGTQFDPDLAVIFVRLVRSGELTCVSARN